MLFGVLSVQLGIVDADTVAGVAETVIRSEMTLGARLEADGRISIEQRRALENIVATTLSREPEETGLEDTLIRVGADPSSFEATLKSFGVDTAELEAQPDQGLTDEQPGRYKRDSEVGRGGLGIVRSAFDRHLGREVAIKELLGAGTRTAAGTPVSGTTSDASVRFKREARVTAQLEHPNIVPVYELGRRPDDTIYYTMRLVRGRTLKQAMREASDLQERLALLPHFVDLCQAMAYAHSRGVIHRDIKPDNVMIGEFGETWVLDWGVAKVRGKDDIRGRELARAIELLQGGSATETLPGSAFGTPSYMSPEQAEGRIDDIDERSDVWSLGVVLFQLLTGKLPITAESLPSLLFAVARGETPTVRSVCEEAPSELAAVAERALERDPSDRYHRAKELAEEIEAYRSGAKVSAYEYSSIELLRRFLARNRSGVAVSLVALVLLFALGIGAYSRLLDERDRAIAAEMAGRSHLADAYVEKARVLASEQRWVDVTISSARALAQSEHAGARGLLIEADGRFRPRLDWSARTFAGCLELALVARDDELACGTSFGVALLDRASGEASGRIEIKGGWLRSVDLRSGWLAGGSGDGSVVLASVTRREVVARQAAHPGGTVGVRFRPGYDEILSAGVDGTVRAWASEDLSPLGIRTKVGARVTAFAVSADGRRFAVGDERGMVTLQGKTTEDVRGHDGEVQAIAFSPTGTKMASASEDGGLLLWNIGTSTAAFRVRRGADTVTALAFSADGRWLYASTEKGDLERFDVRRARLDARVPVGKAHIRTVRPVGSDIYLAGDDKRVRAFAVESSAATRVQRFKIPSAGRGLRFVGEGEGLTLLAADRLIVYDLLERRLRKVTRFDIQERPAAISKDGEWIAVANENEVRLSNVGRKRGRSMRTSGAPIGAVTFSNDGKTIAVGASDGFVRVLAVDGDDEDEVVRVHDGAIDTITFTPDDETMVSGGFDGKVSILPVGKGAKPRRITVHEGGVTVVATSDRYVASGGRDGIVRVYDRKRKKTVELRGHEGTISALAFDSDGRYIASGGEDRRLIVWNVADEQEAARIDEAHKDEIVGVVFAEDGGVLATLAEDGAGRVWSLADLRSDRRRRLAAAEKAYGR